MFLRKTLLAGLVCTTLAALTPSLQANDKIPFAQLVRRGALLSATAFATNFLGYYIGEKLWNWETNHKHFRRGVIGGTGALWLLSNVFIARCALSNKYWQDPKLFE